MNFVQAYNKYESLKKDKQSKSVQEDKNNLIALETHLYQQAQIFIQEYRNNHDIDISSIQKYAEQNLERRRRIGMWIRKAYQKMRKAVVFWNKENARYLTKGIHNADISVITSRWLPDFISDNAVTAITPFFFGSRSQLYFGNMHLNAGDSETFGGASSLQNSDMTVNTFAHPTLAAPQVSLAYNLAELDTNYMDNIEQYEIQLPDLRNKLSNLSQLFRFFFDPLKSGGEPDNFGELIKAKAFTTFHLIQPILLFFVLARLITDQPLMNILISAPIYTVGALWVYRWVWVWIQTAHKMLNNEFNINRDRMESIQRKLRLLEKTLFSSQKELMDTAQQVFPEFMNLYEKQIHRVHDQIANMEGLSNKSLIEHLLFEKYDVDRSFNLSDSDIKDIQQVSQKLGEILVQKTPLPTQINTFSNQTFSFIVAIVTTVLAFLLADEVFKDENLNFQNFIKHLSISAGGAFAAFLIFQRGLIQDKINTKTGKPLPSYRTLFQKKLAHTEKNQISRTLENPITKIKEKRNQISQALSRRTPGMTQPQAEHPSKTRSSVRQSIERSKTKLVQLRTRFIEDPWEKR